MQYLIQIKARYGTPSYLELGDGMEITFWAEGKRAAVNIAKQMVDDLFKAESEGQQQTVDWSLFILKTRQVHDTLGECLYSDILT